MQHVMKFLKDDDGLAVTEYGLLLALVAVAVVAVVKTFGQKIASIFSDATSKLQ